MGGWGSWGVGLGGGFGGEGEGWEGEAREGEDSAWLLLKVSFVFFVVLWGRCPGDLLYRLERQSR